MNLPATVEVSQTPEEKFREYLASRPRPQRFTEQQRDLIRFIFGQHEHFDADQLVDDLKKDGLQISRATVYRTLNKLVDAGLLRCIDVGHRKVYEHDYGYPKHDHLHCEKCNKIIEFRDPTLDAILKEVGQHHNFQISGHSFVIRGVCAECNRARSVKRRLDLV